MVDTIPAKAVTASGWRCAEGSLKLVLRDVRCFHGYHEQEIRPLTFLVGENSSGKTTFLAALSAVLQRSPFPYAPGLAAAPYEVTSFDSVASDHGGQAGRADAFALGQIREDKVGERSLLAEYRDNFGQPSLSRLSTKAQGVAIELEIQGDSVVTTITSNGGPQLPTITVPVPKNREYQNTPLFGPAIFHQIAQKVREQQLAQTVIQVLERQLFYPFVVGGRDEVDPISIAPIRTKPRPAYSQATDQFAPEGDHIPLLLARAFDMQVSSEEQHSQLTSALEDFGENSGLFREIRVKRLGSKPSDPFQLMVKIATQTSNISDVGYGVSQALPVAVQSIMARHGQRLLIQQPEVHLHPRAQAAMGSLFVDLKKREKKQFVVETHSDYLIDRVRQHVAKGEFPAADVLILFFERDGRETTIHPITVDDAGNISNAPSSYRSFFIQEHVALLTGGGDVPNP